MTSKLTVRKLALIVASTAMAGAIHTGAQAAGQVDCNATLTQIAIASQEGGEGGIWPSYAHCVPGAQTAKGATKGAGVAGRPAAMPTASAPTTRAWPDQSDSKD